MTQEAFMQEMISDKKHKWVKVRQKEKKEWGRASTA